MLRTASSVASTFEWNSTNLFCFYRDEGFEAEVRRLLDICIDKASKPIAANIDQQTHETEMHIKENCMYQSAYQLLVLYRQVPAG